MRGFLSLFLALLVVALEASKIDALSLQQRLELFHHMNLAAASYKDFPLESVQRQGLSHRSISVDHHIFGVKRTIKDVVLFEDSKRKEFVVGIFGTDDYKDWVNNLLKSSGRASMLGLHNIQVHGGFFDEAQAIYPSIRDGLVEQGNLGKRLIFDAHSRGGPVAAFIMAMFTDEYPHFTHQCYLFTFNAAPGAAPQFATEFNRRFAGRAFNVYDDRDIVHSAALPGSLIPGEQLPIRYHDSITTHPHMIGSLQSNFYLSHLKDDLENPFTLLPNEEGFYETLENIRGLANNTNSGAYCVYMDDYNVLPKSVDIGPTTTCPRTGEAASSPVPPPARSELLDMMEISGRNALLAATAQFCEDLAFIAVDRQESRAALRRALKTLIKVSAKAYVSNMFSQGIMNQIDYSGMSSDATNQLDKDISRAVGNILNAVLLLADGDATGALKTSAWGTFSQLVSNIAGRDVFIGPSHQICTKGLFGNKVNYISIKSSVAVDVPILQVPGLTAGGSINTTIEMSYNDRVYGMKLVHEYKARCPIGGHIKFLGILQASIYYGNAKVSAAGIKTLSNGDTLVVQYKRKVELGAIAEFRAGSRGNIFTVGLIRDVEWKRWDKFYKEPKNLTDSLSCRHLRDDQKIFSYGSDMHKECLKKILTLMDMMDVGRSQNDYGDGHDHKKVRKALSIYRSGRKNDFVHHSFFESLNMDIVYTKNEDGSETISFSHSTVGGTDTIRTKHGGERRFLWIRYDKRSRSSDKLIESRITNCSKINVTLTTWEDGSFAFVADPAASNNTFTDNDRWTEKQGRWKLTMFYRDYNKSDPQTAKQFVEDFSGKIVNEAILPNKIVREKFICEQKYKKGNEKFYWSGLQRVDKGETTTDEVTHKWSKHLPGFKPIENFIRTIDGLVYTLSSQLERYHGYENKLNTSANFANYTSEGTCSAPLCPDVSTKLLDQNGSPIFNHGGVKLRKTSTVGAESLGKYTATGCMNGKNNVEPAGDYKISQEYRIDHTLLVATGPNGGPILVDVPASDVPNWLGGAIANGSPDHQGAIITVLPYSQLTMVYTAQAEDVPALPTTLDRDLSHIVKVLVEPNSPEILRTDERVQGRQFKELHFVYSAYYQRWLEPSGDILTNPEVTFKIIKDEDLNILSEFRRNFVSEGNDYLAIINLNVDELPSDQFCTMADLSAETRAAINASITGKCRLESSMSETVMKMKDGSAKRFADSNVVKLSDIKEKPEVKTNRTTGGVDVELRQKEINAMQVSFNQHTDLNGARTLNKDGPLPTCLSNVVGTGKDGAPILSNKAPEDVPEAFGGEALRNAIKDESMENPLVTIPLYTKNENQTQGKDPYIKRRIHHVVEDVVNLKPETVKQVDSVRDREGSSVTHEYRSSERIEFEMCKDLGEEGNKFNMLHRESTGVKSRTTTKFTQPRKSFLDAEVVKPGEKLSATFGERADLDSKLVDKIRGELGGHGEVEAQASLRHLQTNYEDGHSELNAFASVSGRQYIARAQTRSDVKIAGLNLVCKVHESTGQGYEYTQHVDNEGNKDCSEQKSLGNIANTQENIAGHAGAPILNQKAPSEIPDELAGQQIQKYLDKKKKAAESKETQVSVNGYQKNESKHKDGPEKDTVNRQLAIVVDDVKAQSSLKGFNLFKGRMSTSTSTEYNSSTTLTFGTGKDLGNGNGEFNLVNEEDNDVASVKEVGYRSLLGYDHLDEQNLKAGDQLNANFGASAELSAANRAQIAKDLSGAAEGKAAAKADLYRKNTAHKDGSVDRTMTTVVTTMTGITESTTVLESSYLGLLNKSQHDVTGKATEYRQVKNEHTDAAVQAQPSLLQKTLNAVGVYSGSDRIQGKIDSSFASTDLGLVTERSTTNQGVLVDRVSTEKLVNGQVPIDPKTGKPAQAQEQDQLSSVASGLVGGIVSSADEFYQRTKADCSDKQKLDTKLKKAEFVAKRALSTVLKGFQAALSNHKTPGSLAVKTVLHCVGKSCLDEMGKPKGLDRWEIMECTGSSMGELALRTGGYAGMAYASYMVVPAVKCCKLVSMRRKENGCSVGIKFCTQDRRTCPAGEECPWDCSADLVVDSAVNSVVGGAATFVLMKCATVAAGCIFGPVGAGVCAVATAAVAAPRVTKAVNERIRRQGNRLLRSTDSLKLEREAAFEKYQKHVRRESLISQLDALHSMYGVFVTIEELEADREPHVIWNRGKPVMLRLHPDRRVQELSDHLDQIKQLPEYIELSPSERSKMLSKERAELVKKQTQEQQDFTETLLTLMALAKTHLNIDEVSAAVPAPQESLGGENNSEPAEVPEETRFKSSLNYLMGIFSYAKDQCSNAFSSVFLYRVYSRDYYSRRLLNRYGLPRVSSTAGLLIHFNQADAKFSEAVCADFTSYLECLHHKDSFGLPTVEYVILTQIHDIISQRAHRDLLVEDIVSIWTKERSLLIQESDSFNPIPTGVSLPFPLTVTTFKNLDKEIAIWFLVDLLLLSPIPAEALSAPLAKLRAAIKGGDEAKIKGAQHPYSLTALPDTHQYRVKYSTKPLIKFLPGLNKCEGFSGELPLSIDDGAYELWGYTQGTIMDKNDSRQWLQAASLTMRSGGMFIRYDGARAYQAKLKPGSNAVTVNNLIYFLYMPSGKARLAAQPLPGLINHGATCYLNSLIQVFAHLPKVKQKLGVFLEFSNVFGALQSNKGQSADPLPLLEAFGISGDMLYYQQDVMETLQSLLNIQVFEIGELFLAHWQHAERTEIDPVNVLSLPMKASVAESLNAEMVNSKLLIAPPHLQRSSFKEGNATKDSGRMEFTEELILDLAAGQAVHYRLQAVIVHQGSISVQTGHYFALCKTKEGGWLAFNDDLVYEDGIENYFGGDPDSDSQAYMLFYERQS